MATILDLPNEVLELIFEYLVTIELGCLKDRDDRIKCEISTARTMRVVCRIWADWFYVRHLYKELRFESEDAHRQNELIDHLATRLSSSVRPNCQVLHLHHLGDPSAFYQPGSRRSTTDEKEGRSSSAFDIVGWLADFFSDSLTEIELRFKEFVSLPVETIEAIGRIRNLRVLRLGLHDPKEPTLRKDSVPETRPDSQCLRSLIVAAQKLKTLDLARLDPVVLTSTIGDELANHQLPAITQLIITEPWEGSCAGLVSLATALKSSIKVLMVSGMSRDSGQRIKPLFEALKDTIEGISVRHSSTVHNSTIHNLKFPKLRVFETQYWFQSFCDFFTQSILKNSEIEVIAIPHEEACCDRPLESNLLTKIPKLRRLVFYNCHPDDVEFEDDDLAACKAHGIECLRLDRDIYISELMEL
ncbi:hypothetical protein PtB15_7B330 [Puccinia triticina]|nr:hypothetical protein PtB15_7B330 [Puccinia triticina]